ncbi:MAG: hypothetical protein HQM15_11190 [Deltaproteobacteria bacterium]|nr:hypothetical protein [Deltaproteobacteria bacterium]
MITTPPAERIPYFPEWDSTRPRSMGAAVEVLGWRLEMARAYHARLQQPEIDPLTVMPLRAELNHMQRQADRDQLSYYVWTILRDIYYLPRLPEEGYNREAAMHVAQEVRAILDREMPTLVSDLVNRDIAPCDFQFHMPHTLETQRVRDHMALGLAEYRAHRPEQARLHYRAAQRFYEWGSREGYLDIPSSNRPSYEVASELGREIRYGEVDIHFLNRFDDNIGLNLLHYRRLLEERGIPPGQEVTAVFLARTDWNGAFNVPHLFRSLVSESDAAVLYFEVGSKQERIAAARHIRDMLGRTALNVIVGGHADAQHMRLDNGPGPESLVEVGDDFSDIRDLVSPQGNVILWGCSTGHGGAAENNLVNWTASQIPSVNVFGINEGGNIDHFVFENRRLQGVVFRSSNYNVIRH